MRPRSLLPHQVRNAQFSMLTCRAKKNHQLILYYKRLIVFFFFKEASLFCVCVLQSVSALCVCVCVNNSAVGNIDYELDMRDH